MRADVLEREVVVHRYYDPATGQFLSVDPLVDSTEQAYGYAQEDPVNNVDPSGLSPGITWSKLAKMARSIPLCGPGRDAALATYWAAYRTYWAVQRQKSDATGGGLLIGIGTLGIGTGAVLGVGGVLDYTEGIATGSLFTTFAGALGVVTGGLFVVGGAVAIGYGVSRL